MTDTTFSLSKEARQRRPYSSLYSALLFQSFQDALAEAMPEERPNDRDDAGPKEPRAVVVGSAALASQV